MEFKSNIFILKWNPDISSVSLDDWDFWVKKQMFLDANWSVFDHEKVNPGDLWYMLRVGEGVTGVVGHGTFASFPQRGEDWAGKGRARYYSDLSFSLLVPHDEPMIPTDLLETVIPNFDWRGGHSGVLLPENDAASLRDLLQQYYHNHAEAVAPANLSIEPGIETDIVGWRNFANLFEPEDIESGLLFSEDAFHDMVTLKTEHVYGDSIFTFSILLGDSNVLPVICKNLKRIKTEVFGGLAYEGYCKIWHDGFNFHVGINGVDVICENLEFGSVSPYDRDSIAVSI